MAEVNQRTSTLWKPIDVLTGNVNPIHFQTHFKILVQQTLERGEGILSENGALVIRTGKFTGRSPKDRFIVKDEATESLVDWGAINRPFTEEKYEKLLHKVTAFLQKGELWVRDCFACADERFRLSIRFISEKPSADLFCYNVLLRPDEDELQNFMPEWTILHAPSFFANPETDGTRQENFVVINFSHKTILIGGTAYTGEIKKSVFSVLNFLLPVKKDVLSMHCSANVGKKGDTALFFGLSGTGKTTLSNHPDRYLIGDDEHGWSADNVFNIEGGCYAKCIHLNRKKEPQIFNAIRDGALVENVAFFKDSKRIDYNDCSITQNTRVSYPVFHLKKRKKTLMGNAPKNIFFLTCDAYGVLPPLARLSHRQAIYYFVSGYTAKIAGTEAGIDEPQATFSPCFAAPFIPLHPMVYANMLREKLRSAPADCWLINTGWAGGGYGTGSRISLVYTRNMVDAVLNGQLEGVPYSKCPVWELSVPDHCPGVPDHLLQPRETWSNKIEYDLMANKLQKMFKHHFDIYAEQNVR